MNPSRKSDEIGSRLQRTLKRSVTLRGIGLHSGKRVEMTILPALADSGISFHRMDIDDHPVIHARAENVFSSRLCTVLYTEAVKVGTVEHLLSALYGLGVDNAKVCVDSEELPILDGSARPYVTALQEAGLRDLPVSRTFFRVRREMQVRDGVRFIRIKPKNGLRVNCTVDFDHPLVNNQEHVFRTGNGDYSKQIAPARTFGFLKDVKALRKAGMARGGSLENAIVIDRFAVLNPGGLRFTDEFVRHKVLDILGDLALLGHPLLGEIDAYRSGHELHHKLMLTMCSTEGFLEEVQMGPDGYAVSPVDSVIAEPGLQSV